MTKQVVNEKELEKALSKHLSNADNIVIFMNKLVGINNWVYSSKENIWLTEDKKFNVAGHRKFYSIKLGGCSREYTLCLANEEARGLAEWYDEAIEAKRKLT